MKRFFNAMAKCLKEAAEIMGRADVYSIEYPDTPMGLYRMY